MTNHDGKMDANPNEMHYGGVGQLLDIRTSTILLYFMYGSVGGKFFWLI